MTWNILTRFRIVETRLYHPSRGVPRPQQLVISSQQPEEDDYDDDGSMIAGTLLPEYSPSDEVAELQPAETTGRDRSGSNQLHRIRRDSSSSSSSSNSSRSDGKWKQHPSSTDGGLDQAPMKKIKQSSLERSSAAVGGGHGEKQSPSRRSPKSPPRSPSWMRYRDSPPRSPPFRTISPTISPSDRSSFTDRPIPPGSMPPPRGAEDDYAGYGQEYEIFLDGRDAAFNFDHVLPFGVMGGGDVGMFRPPQKPARLAGDQFDYLSAIRPLDVLEPGMVSLASFAASIASDTAMLTNMSVSPMVETQQSMMTMGFPGYDKNRFDIQESEPPPYSGYRRPDDLSAVDMIEPTQKIIDYQNSKRQKIKPPATSDWSPVSDLSPILDVSPSVERIEHDRMFSDRIAREGQGRAAANQNVQSEDTALSLRRVLPKAPNFPGGTPASQTLEEDQVQSALKRAPRFENISGIVVKNADKSSARRDQPRTDSSSGNVLKSIQSIFSQSNFLSSQQPTLPSFQKPTATHSFQQPTLPHSQQPTLPHSQQPTLPHSQQPTLPHSQQPTLPHSQQPTLPHSQQPTLPHSQQPTPPSFPQPSSSSSPFRNQLQQRTQDSNKTSENSAPFSQAYPHNSTGSVSEGVHSFAVTTCAPPSGFSSQRTSAAAVSSGYQRASSNSYQQASAFKSKESQEITSAGAPSSQRQNIPGRNQPIDHQSIPEMDAAAASAQPTGKVRFIHAHHCSISFGGDG